MLSDIDPSKFSEIDDMFQDDYVLPDDDGLFPEDAYLAPRDIMILPDDLLLITRVLS